MDGTMVHSLVRPTHAMPCRSGNRGKSSLSAGGPGGARGRGSVARRRGRGAGAGPPHLAPVPLGGGRGRCHLGLLLALFQLLPGQHHLAGVVPTLGAIPATAGASPPARARPLPRAPHRRHAGSPTPCRPALGEGGRFHFDAGAGALNEKPSSRVASDPTGQGRAGRERSPRPGTFYWTADARPSPTGIPGASRQGRQIRLGYGTHTGTLDGHLLAAADSVSPPRRGRGVRTTAARSGGNEPEQVGGGGPRPGAAPVATAPSTSTRAWWPRGRASDVP